MRPLLIILIAVSVAIGGEADTERKFSSKESLATAVQITIKPTREGDTTTFPAGSPVRMLRNDGNMIVILIGETLEQAIVPKSAIVETGGTSGEPISVSSIQRPAAASTVRMDGPPGIWTGIAIGDEDIPSSDPEFEKRVLELTNAERAKRGLAPLVWDKDLARAALYHAGDMYVQNYFEHSSMDGQPGNGRTWEGPHTRIKRFAPYANGENIYASQPPSTPEATVDRWMSSPGHRANILRPAFRKLGVGFIKGSGHRPDSRVVQVFGT